MSFKPILVALDYDRAEPALDLVSKLDASQCRLKIGKELFTSEGPALVEKVQSMGFDVFLDLKFHDIPNTCSKAVKAAAELGVWMVNVHASGGRRMMEASADALANYKNKPKLIAVTVLTSMERVDLSDIGLDVDPQEHVLRLAKLTQSSGLDGVVCSAQEAQMLKQSLGQDFQLVTPGIRPSFAQAGDQRRVMTPSDALKAGVDYMVIGRPITQAKDPLQALNLIQNEITGL
ncbi:orotidine-5'-phosphate decarboxylase [Bermanella marisrubri]|uniref:Orotidine 5'-phosphate decarboxylase n=1 Tax=Bermanella marisrubri TaxID=207949 RepID=Q1N618_9GAMM|nr:orotidine-5'-phosphate decarboxylase [Bermanella marisrubri]EAT13774.1 orotidine 5'-phosphate decarboxylase [Oceanobacter sp. RED65] [Bermanella marisrubri]QIZ84544.1 orotidine-5'-phosphate decarboxylase [Bermanella marisrubri]